MKEDDNDLSSTVIAKSDQLNADDIVEPITITVTRVDKVKAKDQPVHVHSANRQPFKPCLTMRRMLIAAWGKYADGWVGKSMTIYCDHEVLWAGKAYGGIRISHVSHISKPIDKMLAVAKGRKANFTLLPLVATDHSAIIKKYKATPNGVDKEELWASVSEEQQIAINAAFK